MNVYLRHAYAAILCNGMLPPSAITKVCAKSHPRRRRAVERGRCPVRTQGSKVRFADHTATTHFSQETALSDQLWSELGQQPEIAVGKFGKSFRQKPRFAKKSNAA